MVGTAKEPGVWPWPDSLDAVVAAPGSHRVVLENETTRVLEVTIAPGEREPQHTHRWPSVMVVLQPARIRYYTGDTLTFTSPEQSSPAAPGPRDPAGDQPRPSLRTLHGDGGAESGLPAAISASGRTSDASAAALARLSADRLVRPARPGPPWPTSSWRSNDPGFGSCYRSQ